MLKNLGRIMSRNLPTILTVAGSAGVIAGGVLACKATLKADEVLKDNRSRVEAVKEVGISDDMLYRKEITKAYGRNALAWARLYGPAVLVGGFSLGCILYGHKMLRVRNVAIAGAYKALTTDFQSYRHRIAETIGYDEEVKARYCIDDVEVTDLDTGEKEITRMFPANNPDIVGNEHAKFFCESSIYWTKNPEDNLNFLLKVQEKMQKKFDRDGYLFLNDVYDELDIPRTYGGSVCGWIKGFGDDTVDFGIYAGEREDVRRFVNGFEPVILLDFRTDGYIADKI